MASIFGRNAATGLAGSLLVIGLFLAASSSERSASAGEATVYKWNVSEQGLPLLGLNRDRLQPGFAQSLTYPLPIRCTT